jgi:hypothetical protein
MTNTITAKEMELAIAEWLGPRSHLIVPNVSWGMLNHEADLLCLSRSGYATEIEIKVSLSDLRRDRKKRHQHEHSLIRHLYFAVPASIGDCWADVPAGAGIIVVDDSHQNTPYASWPKIIKPPRANPLARRFSVEQQYQLARLGTLRIWTLKYEILHLQERIQALREQGQSTEGIQHESDLNPATMGVADHKPIEGCGESHVGDQSAWQGADPRQPPV